MQKLDRLGWAAGFSVAPYGRALGIRTNDPAVLPSLRALMLSDWKLAEEHETDSLFSLWVGHSSRRGDHPYHLLYTNSQRLVRTHDLEETIRVLDQHLHVTIGQLAPDYLFIHAGVVGWKGKALLLPGHSRAGKSTLVAALVQAGATYYSDDFCVLGPDGLIHPYPKDLTLREQQPIAAADLGWNVGLPALRPGLVAFLQWDPTRNSRLQKVEPSSVVMRLLQHTVSFRQDASRALPLLSALATTTPARMGTRGEADGLAVRLLNLMESAP
jgi:hypothetical protein